MTAKEFLVPLQDRTVSGSVWKVIICPQMDLVAVVLDRNSITIYRTTWQRLATIPVCSAENEVITSIAWSPDGAYIVVGTSSRTLAIYSVDRAASAPTVRAKRSSRETEPIVTRQLSSFPTTILWSTKPSIASETATTERYAKYECRAEKIHQSKSKEYNESCDGLLLVGDAAGMVTILSHNLLLAIARISAAPEGFEVNHIHLSQSHRYCLTSSSCTPCRGEESQKVDLETQFVLRAFDLSPALGFWQELDRLGQEVMNFTSTIKKLSQEAKSVRETWIEGALEVLISSVKKPLEEIISQFTEDGSGLQALHDVYCGARIKGAVLQFLANTLGENGAKEALRSFRNHADDTYATVLSGMLPIAENTVFASSEYRGLARLESRFNPVGVELSRAEKLFHASERLLWSIGDLVTEVETVTQEMEAFLAWLVVAAAQAGGESTQNRPSTLQGVSGKDAELISSFFEKHSSKTSRNLDSDDSITTLLTKEVQPALALFQTVVEGVISKPCEVLSAKLDAFGEVSFSDGTECSNSSVFSGMTSSSNKVDDQEVSIVPSVGARAFVFVRCNFTRRKWMVRRYSLAKLGLNVQSAVVVSPDAVLAVTTEISQFENEDKVPGSVSLYELPNVDSDADKMMDDPETYQAMKVTLPDAIDLSSRPLDTKFCGSITRRDGVIVSVNSHLRLIWYVNDKEACSIRAIACGVICGDTSRKILTNFYVLIKCMWTAWSFRSVLAAPRKVFLFQTPYHGPREKQEG